MLCASAGPPSPGPLPSLHFLLDSLLTSGCPPWVLLEKFQLHFRIKRNENLGKGAKEESHKLASGGGRRRSAENTQSCTTRRLLADAGLWSFRAFLAPFLPPLSPSSFCREQWSQTAWLGRRFHSRVAGPSASDLPA